MTNMSLMMQMSNFPLNGFDTFGGHVKHCVTKNAEFASSVIWTSAKGLSNPHHVHEQVVSFRHQVQLLVHEAGRRVALDHTRDYNDHLDEGQIFLAVAVKNDANVHVPEYGSPAGVA
jgi:hypothetical protein